MKKVWTGKESSGKNYIQVREALDLIPRNKLWLKKTGIPRMMAFDSPMSPAFIEKIESAGLIYKQFRNLADILPLWNVDIFIGELLKFFPARGSDPLTPEQIDFITQGAKTGVHMYCASQDFSQVHKQFRLLVNEVYIVNKVIGSPRPFKGRPEVKHIWGLIMSRKVDPDSFQGDNATMDSMELVLPDVYFIRRKYTDLFDTGYKVPVTEHPPMFVRKQKIIGKNPDGLVVYEKEIWKP